MNAGGEIFNKGTRVKCVEGGHELEEKETRVTQSLLSNTNSLTLKPFVSKIPEANLYLGDFIQPINCEILNTIYSEKFHFLPALGKQS